MWRYERNLGYKTSVQQYSKSIGCKILKQFVSNFNYRNLFSWIPRSGIVKKEIRNVAASERCENASLLRYSHRLALERCVSIGKWRTLIRNCWFLPICLYRPNTGNDAGGETFKLLLSNPLHRTGQNRNVASLRWQELRPTYAGYRKLWFLILGHFEIQLIQKRQFLSFTAFIVCMQDCHLRHH